MNDKMTVESYAKVLSDLQIDIFAMSVDLLAEAAVEQMNKLADAMIAFNAVVLDHGQLGSCECFNDAIVEIVGRAVPAALITLATVYRAPNGQGFAMKPVRETTNIS